MFDSVCMQMLPWKHSMYIYLYYTYPILANQIAEFEVYNMSELPTMKETNQLLRCHKTSIIIKQQTFMLTLQCSSEKEC